MMTMNQNQNIDKIKSKKSELRRLMKLEKNLIRVIKALEYMQKRNYSALTNLTLSYLTDIRDGKVPKKMTSDTQK